MPHENERQLRVMLKRLEAEPWNEFPWPMFKEMLTHEEYGQLTAIAMREKAEQMAAYDAALPNVRQSDDVRSLYERLVDRYGEYTKRKNGNKTLDKQIMKLRLRQLSHEKFFAEKAEWVWKMYDALSEVDKRWFLVNVTNSDERCDENAPKMYGTAPISVALPDDEAWQVKAQKAMIRRLLDE